MVTCKYSLFFEERSPFKLCAFTSHAPSSTLPSLTSSVRASSSAGPHFTSLFQTIEAHQPSLLTLATRAEPASAHTLPPCLKTCRQPAATSPSNTAATYPSEDSGPRTTYLLWALFARMGFTRWGRGLGSRSKLRPPNSRACEGNWMSRSGVANNWWCIVNWREKRCGRGFTSYPFLQRKKTETRYGGIMRSKLWRRSCWGRIRRFTIAIGTF